MADGSFASRAPTAGELNAAIRRLSPSLDFVLRVPGTHYGGLTNQELLEVLAANGRDFAANNATLKRHVATVVSLALEGATRLPTQHEVDKLREAATLEWILKRLNYEVRDVRIKMNTNDYQKLKRKAGFDGPVGVRTGALREAVQKARVVLQ